MLHIQCEGKLHTLFRCNRLQILARFSLAIRFPVLLAALRTNHYVGIFETPLSRLLNNPVVSYSE